MFLSYRRLFSDKNGIEFSVVKTQTAQCLCLQSGTKNLNRLKKAYIGSQYFSPVARDNFFEPLSIQEDREQDLVQALFKNVESGQLADFLRVAPPEWHYATGKKLGRILRRLHSVTLESKHLNKARSRHALFMEHLAQYVAELPHFKNDKFAMEALSERYDNFTLFRPVMRYGSLKHQKIMITQRGRV